MRLNNKNKTPFFLFLYNFAFILFISCYAIYFFLGNFIAFLGHFKYLLLIIPIMLLFILYIRGRQIFEYDSDGETLTIKNINVIKFLDKSLSDEFPKYKLKSYEIINGIFFKRLYITISSKKNNSIILKYDISYLKGKEITDIKHSLSKIYNHNKKNPNISLD